MRLRVRRAGAVALEAWRSCGAFVGLKCGVRARYGDVRYTRAFNESKRKVYDY